VTWVVAVLMWGVTMSVLAAWVGRAKRPIRKLPPKDRARRGRGFNKREAENLRSWNVRLSADEIEPDAPTPTVLSPAMEHAVGPFSATALNALAQRRYNLYRLYGASVPPGGLPPVGSGRTAGLSRGDYLAGKTEVRKPGELV